MDHVVSEAAVERACVTLAMQKGCLLLKLRDMIGIPDRLLVLPNGKVAFIEIKKEGGRLSPAQCHWLKRLKILKQHTYEVDNIKLFMRILDELLSQ